MESTREHERVQPGKEEQDVPDSSPSCSGQASGARARRCVLAWGSRPGEPRRWYDDPPVGTEALLGDGLVEVHIGRGIWQTVTLRQIH